MSTLLIVTPYGAPGQNGVGDQVSLIERALTEDGGLRVKKIGVTPDLNQVSSDKRIVLREDPGALLSLLDREVEDDCTLALHYVCYGFQKRGCPVSLIRYLQKLRRRRRFRLVTIFHELAATGPFWSSTFYVAPLQRLLIQTLASISDRVATSTMSYRKSLEEYVPEVQLHPVISNMGEPPFPGSLESRQNGVVIFGLPASRQRLLQSPILGYILAKLSIEHVIEIGKDCGRPIPDIPHVSWSRTGELPAEDVSKHLQHNRFGLLLYDPIRLAKSGMFAAFAAHRLLPLLIPDNRMIRMESDLLPNIHYLDASNVAADPINLQGIADRSWNWYRSERSLDACKKLYLSWCKAYHPA